MSLEKIIYQVNQKREESQGYFFLTEYFFEDMHQSQMKYIRLKHGKRSIQTESELLEIIMKLVEAYTECIDYFGSIAQNVVVYFQAKVKDINKYYQFFSNSKQQENHIECNEVNQGQVIKDLGSISDQTRIQLLPEDQRLYMTAGKQALSQNIMACLMNQDVTSHMKQEQKKAQKLNLKIQTSIKEQEQKFMQRRSKRRKINKSKVSQSFSDYTNIEQDIARSPNHINEGDDEFITVDLQALDIDSPQKMKKLEICKQQFQEFLNKSQYNQI